MNRPLDKDMIVDTKERILDALEARQTHSALFFIETLTDLTLSLYDIALKEMSASLTDSLGEVPGIVQLAKREISNNVSESFKDQGGPNE